MGAYTKVILLLTVSNCFMLCAWYLHLKWVSGMHWYLAAMVSWGIAFFEYNVHIPANRIGSQVMSLSQLQILQIGMSLLLFIPFSMLVMGKPLKMDYIWASMCLFGAAFFIFRS